VRTIHGTDQGAGKGGWPTIRHFNKGTGYGGVAYEKKTADAMCSELLKDEYMQGHIMEAAGVSLCSIETLEGCNDKEKDFIAKWADKSADDVAAQLKRLSSMEGGAMKPDLKKWLTQRKAVLKQYAKKLDNKDEL